MDKITEKAKRIKLLENLEKELKDQIKALQHKIKDSDTERTYLKEDIINILESNGINKYSDGDVSVTMSDSPFSVVVSDESLIPSEYKKEKIVIDIDKKKLIEDRDLIEIDGIDFIQTKRLLIKA